MINTHAPIPILAIVTCPRCTADVPIINAKALELSQTHGGPLCADCREQAAFENGRDVERRIAARVNGRQVLEY